jgi:hypothetical protein
MDKLITIPKRTWQKNRIQRARSRSARPWNIARGWANVNKPAAKPAAALLAAAGLGALADRLLLGSRAARRRHEARDRLRARLRQGARAAIRRTKYLEGVGAGFAHKATHALPGVGASKERFDDVTLSQKVESIAFREARVPKEHISVNAENGVVYLRGRLDRDDEVEALVRAAAAVEGVQGVTNLLHTDSRTTGLRP